MTALERLRARHAELLTQIRTLIDTATTPPAEGQAAPGLTADQLREVETLTGEADGIANQVRILGEQETRARQVEETAARFAPQGGAEGESSGDSGSGDSGDRQQVTGNARTQDRDPGHYRRAQHNGAYHSIFADLVHAREGDRDAELRLNEHNRALSTGVAGAGIVVPVWLVEEYQALARQGRVLSAMVRQLPLTSPAPMTLQKQTVGTDSVIAEQATENTHPSETDGFATNTDTVTPKPTSGIQVVSRQMIDMTTPTADLLIYGDMLAVYNRKCEDKVCTAVVAAAGAAVTTFTSDATNFTATASGDAITDAAMAVWDNRKLPATICAMTVARWGKFNKFRDSTGRKLYPAGDGGTFNVDGIGSVVAPGSVEGLPVAVTDGLGVGASYPNDIIVMRASDTIWFEGDLQRFRFEEVAGPESVKLGIWAYTAVVVRQAASSVRRVRITAA